MTLPHGYLSPIQGSGDAQLLGAYFNSLPQTLWRHKLHCSQFNRCNLINICSDSHKYTVAVVCSNAVNAATGVAADNQQMTHRSETRSDACTSYRQQSVSVCVPQNWFSADCSSHTLGTANQCAQQLQNCKSSSTPLWPSCWHKLVHSM